MSLRLHDDNPMNTVLPLARGPRFIMIAAPELAALPQACLQRQVPAPPRLGSLTAEWIAESGLDTIVFALFATWPDAWQIGGHLKRMGFSGRLIALSPALPNRGMVERELRADCPDLRLRVLPMLPPTV